MDQLDKPKIPSPIPATNEATNVHLSYIRRDIDEIKSTLAAMTSGFVTRIDFNDHLKTDDDHEERIRLLEESQWRKVGAASVITGILSVIGSYLLSLIQH